MDNKSKQDNLSSAYAEHFASELRAKKHRNKFERSVEKLRHLVEVDQIKSFTTGRCFDCSVGFGRWVEALDHIEDYTAMDVSPSFVEMVKENFPHARVYQGDIRERIPESSASFDTVMAIRTLPPIEGIPEILSEMVRIAKPGGHIIFDYGRKPFNTSIAGVTGQSSAYDIPKIIDELPAKLVKRIPTNSFFPLMIKNSPFLTRAFSSRFNFVPMGVFVGLEKWLSRINYSGIFYVLEKE